MKKPLSNQPGLVDVAARAQVSAGTASHVLNGNHKARIAPATQERVRRAAQELGYRPNMFARSLLGKKSKTLGLMANNLDNPFFIGVARAAWQRAHEIGYEMLLDAQFSSLEMFRDRPRPRALPADGLLLWAETVQDIEFLLGREALGLPLVYLGLMSEADCDSVTFDFGAGMRQILDHLMQRGCRRPVMIVPGPREGDVLAPRSRAHAFHEYCRERTLPGTIFQLRTDLSYAEAALQGGLALAALPASSRPDAAVCYNDLTAIGVYNGLRRGGLRVPQDIAVTGFDGITEGQCLDLPLTTVVLPIDLACGAAIEMLVHRIEHVSNNPPNRISLPSRLLAGATT
ncbi:MAG: LacI family DNA-binding transcriptional regulator [Janthinobacterium lividum]